MGIKLTVDNNFFDRYHSNRDICTKKRILTAFSNKHFSFYPTMELLSELFCLQATPRKQLLKNFAKFLLDIMGDRALNAWNNRILMELGILKRGGKFIDFNTMRELKDVLGKLSHGLVDECIQKIPDLVQSHKAKNYECAVKAKNQALKLLDAVAIKKIKNNGFENCYRSNALTQWKRNLIKDIYERANNLITEQKIDSIVSNLSKLPFLDTYIRLEIGQHYYRVFLNRKVHFGDSYDVFQLVYLAELDCFVSEDKTLKLFAKDMFNGEDKVISFDELTKLL